MLDAKGGWLAGSDRDWTRDGKVCALLPSLRCFASFAWVWVGRWAGVSGSKFEARDAACAASRMEGAGSAC